MIRKINSKYKVHKTIGCATTRQDFEKLVALGKQEINRVLAQSRLFPSENNLAVEQTLSTISNVDICTVGPKIVVKKIYDRVRFNQINEELFRQFEAIPLSKLKTV